MDAITGLILGPLAEVQFRRALSISQGDLSVFVTHPLLAVLLALAAAVIIVPIILRRATLQWKVRCISNVSRWFWLAALHLISKHSFGP